MVLEGMINQSALRTENMTAKGLRDEKKRVDVPVTQKTQHICAVIN